MRETRSGSLENCRSYWPIGPLARPIDVGTVSATGARLTLMPALRSWAAQRVASAVRSPAEPWSWTRADGIRLKPSPRSCCTAPPSWSAATSRPRPAVSSFEARAGEVPGRRADAVGAAVPAAEQDDPAEVAAGDEARRGSCGSRRCRDRP